MKKLVFNLRKVFSKTICVDEDLCSDGVSVAEFRTKIKSKEYNQLASILKASEGGGLIKEKLFCLNCYKLLLMNNHTSIKTLVSNMFEGNYEVKISEEEAIIFYESLDFTSKIFIQERNRTIKKILK